MIRQTLCPTTLSHGRPGQEVVPCPPTFMFSSVQICSTWTMQLGSGQEWAETHKVCLTTLSDGRLGQEVVSCTPIKYFILWCSAWIMGLGSVRECTNGSLEQGRMYNHTLWCSATSTKCLCFLLLCGWVVHGLMGLGLGLEVQRGI